MSNLKPLIDSVIVDLSENKSIEAILLKVQTISFYLKDEEFSSWIKHEQNGYGNDKYPLPDYRKVNCVVKIDVSQYRSMAKNMMFPCEVINDDKICERLTHMSMKGVANGFVVEGLMELVDKGISLLSAC